MRRGSRLKAHINLSVLLPKRYDDDEYRRKLSSYLGRVGYMLGHIPERVVPVVVAQPVAGAVAGQPLPVLQ